MQGNLLPLLLAVALSALAVAALGYWRRPLSGGMGKLDPRRDDEFFALVSFAAEADARACVAAFDYPGLARTMEISRNGKFWLVAWTLTAPAHGPRIRAFRSSMGKGVARHRGQVLDFAAGAAAR